MVDVCIFNGLWSVCLRKGLRSGLKVGKWFRFGELGRFLGKSWI